MGEQPYEPIGNLGVTPLVPPAVAPFPGVNQRQYEIPQVAAISWILSTVVQFLPVGSAPGDETPLRSPLIKSDLKDKPPSAKEVNPEVSFVRSADLICFQDMIPKNKSARGSSDDPRAKDNVKIVAEEKKQRIDMDGKYDIS